MVAHLELCTNDLLYTEIVYTIYQPECIINSFIYLLKAKFVKYLFSILPNFSEAILHFLVFIFNHK